MNRLPQLRVVLTVAVLALTLPALARPLLAAEVPPPPDVAAPPAAAEVTESGLASLVLEPGNGDGRPLPGDQVVVNYTGWTIDGKMFDSSVARGRPSKLPVNRLIPGFQEALQLMRVGEKRRVWIPEKLAYGGQAGKPQGMLVFEIELLGIAGAPRVPEDVAAIPVDAEVTRSGLAWRVIEAGTGDRHPRARSRVTVHYSGWTTDGRMFDSSVARDQPSSFGLGQVIKGWTEGVQLMVEGETRRFWIPEKLAYRGQSGKPQGMLVFDVQLISIDKF